MTKHLYMCPACGRFFELAEGEPLPDHAQRPAQPPAGGDSARGCDNQGPARVSFTLDEARQGIAVAIPTVYTDAETARIARQEGRPPLRRLAHIKFLPREGDPSWA